MKRRVNIQYSIDLEQLPSEVSRLVRQVGEMYCEVGDDSVTQMCTAATDNPLSLNTVTQVDVVRKKLASLDYALADISNIVNGYLTMQVQQNLQQRYDREELIRPAAVSSEIPPEENGEM